MSLELSKQGGGHAGKPVIRALPSEMLTWVGLELHLGQNIIIPRIPVGQ